MTDAPTKLVRTRRITAWWEPTFSPDKACDFTAGDWSLPELAANIKLFRGEDLAHRISANEIKPKFKGIRFSNCDFTGAFQIGYRTIVFDKCEFIACDFGTSTWTRAKFTGCNFDQCSLSQSSWIKSEFRRCRWSNIGMSGNATDFDQVFIENPRSFLAAAYTRLDPKILREKGKSPSFQAARLEETKATVARNIYNNHKGVGDENTFYDACRGYIIQSCRANIYDKLYTVCNRKSSATTRLISAFGALGAIAELSILWIFGTCNAWGRSVSRPLGGLLVTFGGFAIGYGWITGLGLAASLGRAIDVTTIAGFTRSVTPADSGALLWASWVNLIIAIMFYTVFFATVVAKISRNR